MASNSSLTPSALQLDFNESPGLVPVVAVVALLVLLAALFWSMCLRKRAEAQPAGLRFASRPKSSRRNPMPLRHRLHQCFCCCCRNGEEQKLRLACEDSPAQKPKLVDVLSRLSSKRPVKGESATQLTAPPLSALSPSYSEPSKRESIEPMAPVSSTSCPPIDESGESSSCMGGNGQANPSEEDAAEVDSNQNNPVDEWAES